MIFLSTAFLSLAISGCSGNDGSQRRSSVSSNSSSQTSVEDDRPIVFVMSGQSNMEGQTDVGADGAYLTRAFESLGITDGEDCLTGINSVLTSYYGNGYGELDRNNYNTGGQSQASRQPHASNAEDKIKGKFLPTKIGMGHADSQMGPELGCAYALKDYGSDEKPIYFVKMASSGSGFAQSDSSATDKNW